MKQWIESPTQECRWVAQQSEIEDAKGALETSISTLNECLETLWAKLDPIRVNHPQPGGSIKDQESLEKSQLGEFIFQQASRIRSIKEHVKYITSSLSI